ncbi:hypothetical protein FLL45_01580 [Aliikangiella marina]|uniref:Uncharacterized protein n=1 Tax=Aliikangiella marina TaxID=1712262 RepID=A0A545THJ8_9GAMM|nr:hypothetical protein [Aliikangiella marina]TQV76678.1 hypothetical protein FLL45_01580 [Aliikangiella marina]
MYFIIIDSTTKKIKSNGVLHDQETFDAQPIPDGCEIIEFQGGIRGKYFVNGQMQDAPPS